MLRRTAARMPTRCARRYPGHDRSEMREFTTAILAPLLRARRRKFGQNSVSAITINPGLRVVR